MALAAQPWLAGGRVSGWLAAAAAEPIPAMCASHLRVAAGAAQRQRARVAPKYSRPLLLLVCCSCQSSALENGLALRPPMGWRSWEAFYGSIDERKMFATMDALVDRSRGGVSLADLGFRDAGLDAGFEDCRARKVGGKPAFHSPDGHVLIDKQKFPSGLKAMVNYGHRKNLTVSWYGNACACSSENSYSNTTRPTVAQAIAGTVADTVAYGFDGLKLDSCSQFNNMTLWAEQINRTGHQVLLENCHQGGLVPGQKIPGQHCKGDFGVSDCPYHMYRSSDDIYNHWENIINNINSVTPYLTQEDPEISPRSRPGGWAYPDMLEVGNLGCKTGTSCNQSSAPVEDRSQFGMWAIVSAPLILSVDLTNKGTLDRIWPIVSNQEVIAVNQHWNGSPGQLLLTDKARYPSAPNSKGFYTYPGQLGQSRGWKDVLGMADSPAGCVDKWTASNCTRHYMTLGWGPMNMTVAQADEWCARNNSCYGFTFKTNATGVTEVYMRDDTQIFFMDSQIDALTSPPDRAQWTSHITKSRAAPLSHMGCLTSPCTSGLQIWVKDMSSKLDIALALLFVNLGNTTLSYSLPISKLPPYFEHNGSDIMVRDLWNHETLPVAISASSAIQFSNVQAHDSVMYMLRPTVTI